MFLAGVRDASLRTHTHIFLKPIKNQSAWRPVLGILTLLRVSTSIPHVLIPRVPLHSR